MANFVSDTFSPVSDEDLTIHLPEIGGAWIKHPSYSGVLTVISATGLINGNGIDLGVHYNNANPINADYEITVGIKVVDKNIPSYPAACARINTLTDTHYQLYFDQTDLKLHLRKVIAGVITSLSQSPGVHHIVNNRTYSFALRVVGSLLTVKWDNVVDFSFIDTNISDAGKAGLFQYGGSAQQLTSFQALDLGVSADSPFATSVDGMRIGY